MSEGVRDIRPPARPAGETGRTPDGLLLGINFEEFYFAFGEGWHAMLHAAGIGAGFLATGKLPRLRAHLSEVPDPGDLLRGLDDIVDLVALDTPADRDRLRAEATRIERLLDTLMSTVRARLARDAGAWYDVGVFLARFHLCVTMVADPPTRLMAGDWEDVYRRELLRVAPSLTVTIGRVTHLPSWLETSASLRRALLALVRELASVGTATGDWCRTARQRADQVFTGLGMIGGGKPPLSMLDSLGEPRSAQPAPDPAETLNERLSAARELLRDDPRAAEAAMRELLLSIRRTLGPGHPMAFLVQADLCLVLLVLGRRQLAVDLAYDTADDAARRFGEHDPVVAVVQTETVRVLLMARRADQARSFLDARLAWLLSAGAEDLSDDLLAVRESLTELVAPGPKVSAP